MENKKIINILAVSGVIVLFAAFLFDYECVFKRVLDIPCISCGLTRGFIYIINFDLYNAFKINILSIPIFIMCFIFYLLYFIWLLFNKHYIFKFYSFFINNYKVLIFILLICWVINIYY